MVTTVTVTVLVYFPRKSRKGTKVPVTSVPMSSWWQLQSPVISSITQIAAYEEYGSGCHFTDNIDKGMIGMEIGLL